MGASWKIEKNNEKIKKTTCRIYDKWRDECNEFGRKS